MNARLFLIFLIGILFLVPQMAAAQGNIAVVDVGRVLAETQAAISLNKQREVFRQEFLTEISKTEQELRKEEQSLQENKGDIEPEAYAKRIRAYEEKVSQTRRLAQDKKRMLEEASNTAMNRIREQLYLVVQSIAQEKGFELVISNKNVIAGANSLDVTEETIKRMNETLKNIEINIQDQEDKNK